MTEPVQLWIKDNSRKGATTQRKRKIIVDTLAAWRLGARMTNEKTVARRWARENGVMEYCRRSRFRGGVLGKTLRTNKGLENRNSL